MLSVRERAVLSNIRHATLFERRTLFIDTRWLLQSDTSDGSSRLVLPLSAVAPVRAPLVSTFAELQSTWLCAQCTMATYSTRPSQSGITLTNLLKITGGKCQGKEITRET